MKKILSLLLAVALILSAVPFVSAAPTDFVIADCVQTNGTHGSPAINAGGSLTATVTFEYKGTVAAPGSVVIDLKTSADLSTFPFVVEQTTYRETVNLRGGSTNLFDYSLDLSSRSDAQQDFYPLTFTVTYGDPGSEVTEELDLVVELIHKSESSTDPVAPMPTVIVTGYTTSPKEVVAGEDFSLSVTFKNTSAVSAVSNLKAQLSSDGTFNPVSGSSTLFTEALSAGGSVTKSIRLSAKADAAPGSYNVSFALSYDYPNAKDGIPASATEIISIPVKQVPKISVSSLQLSSSDIFLGQDLNIMANVNNLGKATIYNVNAVFADANGILSNGECFLGNIASGSTGNIDVYMPSLDLGEGAITLTLTYEDESGNVYTYTDTTSVFVMEKYIDPGIDMPIEEPAGFNATWLIIVIVLLCVGGLVVFLVLRKKKKLAEQKKRERQEALRLDREFMEQEESNEEIKL